MVNLEVLLVYIDSINEYFFKETIKQKISVSIIDSGFKNIPSYAKLYGLNKNPDHQHGNRILSIFTALDKKYPISGLSLNLSCYNSNDGYLGLLNAIQRLPYSDILSISISWKDDNKEIYHALKQKANIICVPYSIGSSTPYPALYNEMITCSNTNNDYANYSICPNPDWSGNSYAVPAIARLLCYNDKIVNDKNGIKIKELFNIQPIVYEEKKIIKELSCPFCKRILRTKFHTLMIQKPEYCPYCGEKI